MEKAEAGVAWREGEDLRDMVLKGQRLRGQCFPKDMDAGQVVHVPDIS